MSSRHCSPAVTISGPFPFWLPGTAHVPVGTGKLGGKRGQENSNSCPWMSAGRKAVGREGGREATAASGLGEQRGSKGVKVRGKCCSAPAAQPHCPWAQPGSSALPVPKCSTRVRPRVLQGALLHQRAGKGFTPHLWSLLHIQSSLHSLDVKGNEALAGFPETTNNLMTA